MSAIVQLQLVVTYFLELVHCITYCIVDVFVELWQAV